MSTDDFGLADYEVEISPVINITFAHFMIFIYTNAYRYGEDVVVTHPRCDNTHKEHTWLFGIDPIVGEQGTDVNEMK